jgi:hypothetical protein
MSDLLPDPTGGPVSGGGLLGDDALDALLWELLVPGHGHCGVGGHRHEQDRRLDVVLVYQFGE